MASASLIPSGPVGGLASETQILQQEAFAEEKRESLSGAQIQGGITAAAIKEASPTTDAGDGQKELRSKSAPGAAPANVQEDMEGEPQIPEGTSQSIKSDILPGSEVLNKIYGLHVQDKDGKDVQFGSLVHDSASASRNVIVFIRHFFCGSCQQYVRALFKALPPMTLSALDPPTTLTIIGCGSSSLISTYSAETSCPYPIYADPSRAIYQALDLSVNLDVSSKRPGYITMSLLESTWNSIKQGLKVGLNARKSGRVNQNGGEFVWVGGELTFAHKMKDTTGHLEVKDLKRILQ